MPRRGRPPSPDILTPRETDVVVLVANGLTNTAIAEQLGISEQGVKYHLNQVYAKRDLAGREELIAWANSHVFTRFDVERSVLLQTTLSLFPVRRGKVRDVYDLGDTLLIVSTDRISAFDWVTPTGIPDKGRALTQLSRFWFDHVQVPHHVVSVDPAEFGLPADVDTEPLMGRTMLVRKTEVVPVECVVRGYLTGSGWEEYCQTGGVCGIRLPDGLEEGAKLPEPIFTPATKAAQGEHDENISFERMVGIVGVDLAEDLRERSLRIYGKGAQHAASRGIIVADTKFEFGRVGGEVLLIDEVLTPDSSRFWPADQYAPGRRQPAFDKQFLRDWLSDTGWDKSSPPPPLPADVVARTREKYIEAYERITGQAFPWN